MIKFSLKNYFSIIVMLFVVVLFAAGCSSKSEHATKIKEAMTEMKSDAAKLGAAQVVDDSLFFGSTKMNENFDLVDALTKKYGCTATFFLKKGNEFIRISTDIMQEGHRAIGTQLDPNGPAIKELQAGKPFYGVVDILGKQYETGYEPILNNNNEVIGAFYVGYEIEKK